METQQKQKKHNIISKVGGVETEFISTAGRKPKASQKTFSFHKTSTVQKDDADETVPDDATSDDGPSPKRHRPTVSYAESIPRNEQRYDDTPGTTGKGLYRSTTDVLNHIANIAPPLTTDGRTNPRHNQLMQEAHW